MPVAPVAGREDGMEAHCRDAARDGSAHHRHRAVLAAYCQSYGRWVEAEKKLAETPALIRTPSGYVQQSPWLSVANKQMELMGRAMAELGLTPASRSRIALPKGAGQQPITVRIVNFTECLDDHGNTTIEHDGDIACGKDPRHGPAY